MLDVAADLNYLRPRVRCFDGTDVDSIDRSCQNICRPVADIPVAWETNNRQLILLLNIPRISKLYTWHIIQANVDNSHVFFVKRALFFNAVKSFAAVSSRYWLNDWSCGGLIT